MSPSPRVVVELAERGAATIAQALSPLTTTLSEAEARRLATLLERMLGTAEDPPARRSDRPASERAPGVRPG